MHLSNEHGSLYHQSLHTNLIDDWSFSGQFLIVHLIPTNKSAVAIWRHFIYRKKMPVTSNKPINVIGIWPTIAYYHLREWAHRTGWFDMDKLCAAARHHVHTTRWPNLPLTFAARDNYAFTRFARAKFSALSVYATDTIKRPAIMQRMVYYYNPMPVIYTVILKQA